MLAAADLITLMVQLRLVYYCNADITKFQGLSGGYSRIYSRLYNEYRNNNNIARVPKNKVKNSNL